MRRVPRWWYWALASISWFVLAQASCYKPLACLQDGDCEQGFHCQPQSGECLQLCSPSRPCSAGQRCDLSKGRCLTSPACSPRARRACLNGHMMWVDSCGIPEEQSDDCGTFGCTDAGCNPDPCGDGSDRGTRNIPAFGYIFVR